MGGGTVPVSVSVTIDPLLVGAVSLEPPPHVMSDMTATATANPRIILPIGYSVRRWQPLQ